jgi:PAS domain S-box-containing protein
VAEFDVTGVITWANGRFLSLMGYGLSELVGQHHRVLCDPEYAASAEYEQFWGILRHGDFEQGTFPRRRADGSEVWMQASYNPIFNQERGIQRVLKVATDVTRQVLLERALQAEPREALYGQGVALTRFAREHPALFGLVFGPQHGHAGSAAITRADDVLERRASEVAPDDSAAAKLACRALVQGLAVIEASGRLAPGERPEAAIRFFTDRLG